MLLFSILLFFSDGSWTVERGAQGSQSETGGKAIGNQSDCPCVRVRCCVTPACTFAPLCALGTQCRDECSLRFLSGSVFNHNHDCSQCFFLSFVTAMALSIWSCFSGHFSVCSSSMKNGGQWCHKRRTLCIVKWTLFLLAIWDVFVFLSLFLFEYDATNCPVVNYVQLQTIGAGFLTNHCRLLHRTRSHVTHKSSRWDVVVSSACLLLFCHYYVAIVLNVGNATSSTVCFCDGAPNSCTCKLH